MQFVRTFVNAVVGTVLLLLIVQGMQTRWNAVPPGELFLDPARGVYSTARNASYPQRRTLNLTFLEAPVTVIRDRRGVPHIYAGSAPDAIATLGYITAQDRLFQMDFLPRVAGGRLSSAVGARAISTDRYLRSTGMEWGAQRNLRRIRRQNGQIRALLNAYAAGVNAYLTNLPEHDLPLEFRLLGYRPDPYAPIRTLRLLQYMAFDLSFRNEEADYPAIRQRLDNETFRRLYPRQSILYAPIIPDLSFLPEDLGTTTQQPGHPPSFTRQVRPAANSEPAARDLHPLATGYKPPTGSNNWGVQGSRSTTGDPILAGDIHFDLTIPDIWYEAHLVTPDLNIYGVTVPGAPLIVTGITPTTAWTFTNSLTDQLDHYRLSLDSSRTRYRYNGHWKELRTEVDTIEVNRSVNVLDTVHFSHWGPVLQTDPYPVAVQWTAHRPNTTLEALWEMNTASNISEFRAGVRKWDAPMQNILYGDTAGNLAMWVAGTLPIRKSGHGQGIFDGSSPDVDWEGEVPFAYRPHVRNPDRGFVTSSNQQPTPPGYPYYLGNDWPDGFRSIRLNHLLSEKEAHSAADFKRYQSDVHAVQHDLFMPFLDTLQVKQARPNRLRQMIVEWNGQAAADETAPLVFYHFLNILKDLTWDELGTLHRPQTTVLWNLLRHAPDHEVLDQKATSQRETAGILLKKALRRTAHRMAQRYGWNPDEWTWERHHQLWIPHLTQSNSLQSLGRGPYPIPGFRQTVFPAGGLTTTGSASWRMIVDFSSQPPQAWGIYPGGSSGNPFSRHYDIYLDRYLNFDYYRLPRPESPDQWNSSEILSTISLQPNRP